MKYLFILFLLIVPTQAYAGVEELCSSVVRITDEKAMGTGFCIKEDAEKYYLITAGHIYVDGGSVYVDLFHDGYIMRVWGQSEARQCVENTTLDWQVVSVLKKDIKDYSPLIPVKIADKVEKEGVIWTWGCSDGAWPTAFKGRLLSTMNFKDMWFVGEGGFVQLVKETDDMVYFLPTPEKGRSGSPIFNDKYELIGMILMQNPPHGGIAVSVNTLKEEIK